MISIEAGGDLEQEFDVYGIEHYVIDTGRIFSIKGMKKLYHLLKKLKQEYNSYKYNQVSYTI